MATIQVAPSPRKVEAQIVEMRVPLYSYGCEKKVKKALSHIRGIHSINVDYDQQKVTVWGICDRDVILATIKKKRKESRFWNLSETCKDMSKCEEEAIIAAAAAEEDELSPHTVDEKESRDGRKRSRKLWKQLFPRIL